MKTNWIPLFLAVILVILLLTGCSDGSYFHYEECLLTESEQEWDALGCQVWGWYIP